jgi:hypothetical protein
MIASFANALHTAGPASDRAANMSLYGWLIGDWEMETVVHADDGTTHRGRGEIHFGWVLEGRAIQDVWILPGVFYGTTLRIYDPGLDAWHILWSDPLRQYYTRQIGHARGKDIVQDGNNMPATRSAGASPRSPRSRSVGWANARATAAPLGSCRPSTRHVEWPLDSSAQIHPHTRRELQ